MYLRELGVLQPRIWEAVEADLCEFKSHTGFKVVLHVCMYLIELEQCHLRLVLFLSQRLTM